MLLAVRGVNSCMKLSELSLPPTLFEGTWSLPDSPAAVLKVIRLLDGPPIKATDGRKLQQISKLLGSDRLFDELDAAKSAGVADIRPILIKHLPNFVDTSRWGQPPSEETQFAINLLKKKFGIRD